MAVAAPRKVRYLPPPVRFVTGCATAPANLLIVLASLLWCTGALAVLCGLPLRLDTLVMGLAVLTLSGCAVYLEAHPREKIILDWSAQGWHASLASDATNPTHLFCTPIVVLDFQRLLLVRVQGLPGGVRWLWCQQQDVSQWHKFRCALFAARQP